MRPESIEEKRARRKVEAVKGLLGFAVLQFATALCFWALTCIPDSPNWLVMMFSLLAVFCILLLIPGIVVLRQRFHEIEGGELDEAGKY